MPSDNARYIPPVGGMLMKPPYRLGTAGFPWHACGFFLEACRHRLQELVDEQLNGPLGLLPRERLFSVQPDVSSPDKARMLLTFNLYGQATTAGTAPGHFSVPNSTPEPFNGHSVENSWLSYREVIFMVPLLQRRVSVGANLLEVAEHPQTKQVWFLPVIFIDGVDPSGVAIYPITMGREIYGLSKSMGRIGFRPPGDMRPYMSTGTLDVFAPDAAGRLVPQRLVHVKAARPAVGPVARSIGDVKLWAEQRVGGPPKDAYENPLARDLIGLKQFPDPCDVNRAAYQAVVATSLAPDPEQMPVGMLRDHVIEFHRVGHLGAVGRLDVVEKFGLAGRRVTVPHSISHSFNWCSTAEFASSAKVLTRADFAPRQRVQEHARAPRRAPLPAPEAYSRG